MLPWLVIFPNKNKPLARRGFTLIELLIAVSIFAVISLAIYATFSSGAAVLRRVKNIDLAAQRILLKTENFSRQLREQVACRKTLFAGTENRISFCANIDNFPYRITYYYNDPDKALMRVEDRLDKIIDETGKLNPDLLNKPTIYLSKVTEVQFSYLYFDPVKNEYFWATQWKKNFLPRAVKFIFFMQQEKYESTVYLPKA